MKGRVSLLLVVASATLGGCALLFPPPIITTTLVDDGSPAPSVGVGPGAGGTVLPVRIQAKGHVQDHGGYVESCPQDADVLLVVAADGSAHLFVNAFHSPDVYNCPTEGGLMVTYDIVGTASGDVATFNSCNEGGFDARGSVRYADGTLSGSASCLYNRGDHAVPVAIELTIP
jgi:hypothetical protein